MPGRRRLRAVLVARIVRPIGLRPGGRRSISRRIIGVAVTDFFVDRRMRAVELVAPVMLRGRGDLDGRGRKQAGSENGQDGLLHFLDLPCASAQLTRQKSSRRLAPLLPT